MSNALSHCCTAQMHVEQREVDWKGNNEEETLRPKLHSASILITYVHFLEELQLSWSFAKIMKLDWFSLLQQECGKRASACLQLPGFASEVLWEI